MPVVSDGVVACVSVPVVVWPDFELELAVALSSAERGGVVALPERLAHDQLGHGDHHHGHEQGDQPRWPAPRPGRCAAVWRSARAGGRPAPARRRRVPRDRGRGASGSGLTASVAGAGLVEHELRLVARERAGDALTRPVQQLAHQRHDHGGDRRGDPGAGDPELRGHGGCRCGGRARDHERARVETTLLALLLALTRARRRSHRTLNIMHALGPAARGRVRADAGPGAARLPTWW